MSRPAYSRTAYLSGPPSKSQHGPVALEVLAMLPIIVALAWLVLQP